MLGDRWLLLQPLIRLLTRPSIDTDGKQVTQNLVLLRPSTVILVLMAPIFEGKVTVDDPMEAVKAIVQDEAAGADFYLSCCSLWYWWQWQSGTRWMWVKRRLPNCWYRRCWCCCDSGILMRISQMEMVQASLCEIPWWWCQWSHQWGNLWLWLVNSRSFRHHGCQIDFTRMVKWKVVNSKVVWKDWYFQVRCCGQGLN